MQPGWRGLRLRPDIVGTEDGLAKYPYIRESRRVRAEFTVLEQHVGTEARMKATAILLNTARGQMVDQEALLRALEDDTIAGAGLDVTDPEPLPQDDPLHGAPNLVLTPHIGWANQRNFSAFVENLVANVIGYLDGDMSVVANPEALASRRAASAAV